MATDLAPERSAPSVPRPWPEQSRARYPYASGFVERRGGRVAYEVYGAGDPPIMFVPPWQIVHSRIWKAQIPEFSRRHKVVAWDARGNGRSDRPTTPEPHSREERAKDLLAVLDATGTPSAVLVSLSSGAGPAVVATSMAPDRVLGHVFVAPAISFAPPNAHDDVPFDDPLDSDEGWNKENIHYWRRDFEGYLEFFFSQVFTEPHSTKQREDAVGYGLDTDAETLLQTVRSTSAPAEAFRHACEQIRCPTLVIQGTDDQITSVEHGILLARAIPGASLVLLDGSGHAPQARDPIAVNLLIREFIASLATG